MRSFNQKICATLAIQLLHLCSVEAFTTTPRSLAASPHSKSISQQFRASNSDAGQVLVRDAQLVTNSEEGESSTTKYPATMNDSASNGTDTTLELPPPSRKSSKRSRLRSSRVKRKMELAWCNQDACGEAIREKVVGDHNHMELTGPATGQVAYSWEQYSIESVVEGDIGKMKSNSVASPPAVLMLVKREDEELTKVAVEAIQKLVGYGVQVLVDSTLAGELTNYETVDMESDMIRLFEPQPVPGFGTGDQLFNDADDEQSSASVNGGDESNYDDGEEQKCSADLSDADLIVTLGGDGLLMYAAHVFCGPVPPILPVAGGSMGFLTPFQREEMVEAILISLGIRQVMKESDGDDPSPNGLIENSISDYSQYTATTPEGYTVKEPLAFGKNNKICISMRMRLDCRIFNADGSLKSRYNVLNEVVIDRGSSPYLASLECFCDDVHLTTVQADGIIFSTPTGSTAYSMAAGGSVVHPAVPAILVTPICPHVLSFRSMIFPDHVVLRCYVPDDARSTACVYFDGKHRTELHRGDSVQIEMSAHPVPTINRADHSSDWLSSLKRNFNFNTRVRQNPLK